MRRAYRLGISTWQPPPITRTLRAMVFTDTITDDGQRRIYFTRVGSVITYFIENADGGVDAIAEPGEFACPWSTTPAKLEATRQCALTEAAQRLDCTIADLRWTSMDTLQKICTPLPDYRYTWTGRVKVRGKLPRRAALREI